MNFRGTLLIALFVTALWQSAPGLAESDQNGLKYFDDLKPREVVLKYTQELCGDVAAGSNGFNFKGFCESNACKGTLEVNNSAYQSQVFLSPSYDLLFSRNEKDKKTSEKATISLQPSGTEFVFSVEVTSNYVGLDKEMAESLTNCFSEISAKIKEKYKDAPFEELINFGDDLVAEHHTIDEAFSSLFSIHRPRTIVSGESFVISAVLIPSLGFNPILSTDTSVRHATAQIETSIENSLEEVTPEELKERPAEFYISQWSEIPFDPSGAAFNSAQVSLTGSAASITQISQSEKELIGLTPSEWHWLLKVDQDTDFVISFELSTEPPLRRSFILRIEPEIPYGKVVFDFFSNNLRWFLATLIIPVVLIFVKAYAGSKS